MNLRKPQPFRLGDYKKPHLAIPSFDSPYLNQTFNNRKEAVKYLNKTTGYYMQAEDWAMLGKLIPIR